MSCLKNDESIINMTFSQIYAECLKIANILKSYGIEVGDRFAIAAQHGMETVIVGYSLLLAHITAVPIDMSLPSEEVNRLLKFADVRGIYYSPQILYIG